MKKPYIIGIMTVVYLAVLYLVFYYGTYAVYNMQYGDDIGAKPVTKYTEAEVVTFLEAEKTAEFLETGDYTQIDADKLLEKYSDKLPYETELWAFDGPDGKGYQVVFIDYIPTVSATSTWYTQQTKSYGFGVNAEQNTWDWR